jgi:hypothetical protein
MDKNINNNSIIYNGIWILINYCYLRDDNLLNHLLITPKCFRIYEKIILSNDVNLFYQIIWLFYNITVKDDETSYDIISSSLFKDNIIKLLDQDIFLNNVNEDNIYNSIIIEAIHFLYNLIRANKKLDDCVYELEISNMKLEIIKVLIKFLVINNEKSYGKILKAIVKFSDISQSSYSTKILTVSFVENLIDKKKMFSNIEIILLINRIIGNFIAVNDDNLIKNNEKIILLSLGYISFLSLLYYRDINFLKIIALNIIFNLLSIPALYFLLFKLTEYFSLKIIIILLLTLITQYLFISLSYIIIKGRRTDIGNNFLMPLIFQALVNILIFICTKIEFNDIIMILICDFILASFSSLNIETLTDNRNLSIDINNYPLFHLGFFYSCFNGSIIIIS